jgi:hypothetical protein
MGIWNDANDIGADMKHKQQLKKHAEEAAQQATPDPEAEARRHEENKEQGML